MEHLERRAHLEHLEKKRKFFSFSLVMHVSNTTQPNVPHLTPLLMLKKKNQWSGEGSEQSVARNMDKRNLRASGFMVMVVESCVSHIHTQWSILIVLHQKIFIFIKETQWGRMVNVRIPRATYTLTVTYTHSQSHSLTFTHTHAPISTHNTVMQHLADTYLLSVLSDIHHWLTKTITQRGGKKKWKHMKIEN